MRGHLKGQSITSSWYVLSRARRKQEGFHQPPHFVLGTAYIPLQAEFMTFLSTASLMHKAKYQRHDSDTQALECLLLLGPRRGALTVSMGHYNLKSSHWVSGPSLSSWHTSRHLSLFYQKEKYNVSDPKRSKISISKLYKKYKIPS